MKQNSFRKLARLIRAMKSPILLLNGVPLVCSDTALVCVVDSYNADASESWWRLEA